MIAADHAAADQPFVALVCAVPLIYEALRELLLPIARIQFFPAADGTTDLLRWVKPDAVVVDDDGIAAAAVPYAAAAGCPLVHVSLANQRVRVYREGTWTWAPATNGVGITSGIVRDVLAGCLYGRVSA